MISVGFFSEMNITAHNDGSVKDYICEKVDYDKSLIIKYLSSFSRYAVCPRYTIDCVTGETISSCFRVYDDGEYCWPDFLIYHIEKYNIKLPQDFINRIQAKTAQQ